MAGFCERGNEPSDSIKGGESLDYVSGTISLSRRTLLRGDCYGVTYLLTPYRLSCWQYR
jgi:hypothetical protein